VQLHEADSVILFTSVFGDLLTLQIFQAGERQAVFAV
jgi:hypothetical protein